MRRRLLLLLVLPLALSACKKGHPISVRVSPDFQKSDKSGVFTFGKIAVFPFQSALHHSDDPDGVAPVTMDKFFLAELDKRTDYKFISSNTVLYAVEREQWMDRYKKFLDSYDRSDEVDKQFITDLAGALQCDAFLIPIVDAWQKDEVDVQENASAVTTVGATITIVDGMKKPGTVLFRATDEDYEEGVRSETADRTLVRSSSGILRSDPGAKAFAAPPFEDVAPRVVRALVTSLPPR